MAIICSYGHIMETILTKSSYHNEYYVENLASIFFIFTPIEGQVEILDAIWLHDASKKNFGRYWARGSLGVAMLGSLVSGPFSGQASNGGIGPCRFCVPRHLTRCEDVTFNFSWFF